MLIYVTGLKGGIGKSFITNLVIYYYTNVLKVDPIVIDTDTSSPDIYWSNKDDFTFGSDLITANTSNHDGWALLIETAYKNKDKYIVVNAPAKEDESIAEHGRYLDKLAAQGIDVITFFVINDNGNAIKQIDLYREYVKSRICIIKNSGKTKLNEDNFTSFNSSQFNTLPSVFIPCESTGYVSKYTHQAKDEEKKSLRYLFNSDSNKNTDEQTGDFGYIFMTEEWLSDCMQNIKKAIEIAK